MYSPNNSGYGSLGGFNSGAYGTNGSYRLSNSYSADYSHLEHLASQNYATTFSISEEREVINLDYANGNYTTGTYLGGKEKHDFTPEIFLDPNRETAEHIESNEKIMPLVKKTFKLMMGKEFPEQSIKIIVCSEEELKMIHEKMSGLWDKGIQGFSINKFGKGVSEIFVKGNEADGLMLTVGHEIGHVMSPALSDARDEEAKAFAFSLVWMQTIAKHNVGGLTKSINPMPAKNGLHNVAFDFVMDLIDTGEKATQIFTRLIKGAVSINKRMERIIIG